MIMNVISCLDLWACSLVLYWLYCDVKLIKDIVCVKTILIIGQKSKKRRILTTSLQNRSLGHISVSHLVMGRLY